MNHPPSLRQLQGPVPDQTLAPGLVGLCALSAVEEDHRRDPGVMDRYRGRDAISMLVSPGPPGQAAVLLVDTLSKPEVITKERLIPNDVAPSAIHVRAGHPGPHAVPVVDQVRGPEAVVMERSN